MSYSIVTIGGSSINNEVLAAAYASFVKHGPEIFGEDPKQPTINPATGQTVYADIETRQVWENMVRGVVSENGKHQAFVSVARDASNTTVGFCFGIYHASSNTANLTYAGVDQEHRGNFGVFAKDLRESVVRAIDLEARAIGHDGVNGIFVEVESSKNGQIKMMQRRLGYEPALSQWVSPLLISNGAGRYDEQTMTLMVHWPRNLSPEAKTSTATAFGHDFYALYSGPLRQGGDVQNENRLYPATESLGYQPVARQVSNLAAMETDANRLHGIPVRPCPVSGGVREDFKLKN